MVEHLKHEGTSHSFSDLLKICVKMGPAGQHRFLGRLVTHRLGLVAFLLLFFLKTWPAHVVFTYL